MRQSAEVETQMTSVERIASYADLPQEKGYRSTLHSHRQHSIRNQTEPGQLQSNPKKNSSSVIQKGSTSGNALRGSSIVIKKLSVQYRDDQATPVIHNLSLEIQVHTHIQVPIFHRCKPFIVQLIKITTHAYT